LEGGLPGLLAAETFAQAEALRAVRRRHALFSAARALRPQSVPFPRRSGSGSGRPAGVVSLIFNTIGIPHYSPDVAAEAGLEICEPGAVLRALLALLRRRTLAAFRAPTAAFTMHFFQHQGPSAPAAATAALLGKLAGLA
jgi:hypothetical protein